MNSCFACRNIEDSSVMTSEETSKQKAEETKHDEKYNKLLKLATLKDESRDGRAVKYATCGDPRGNPILFFPPLGGTRRMMLVLRDSFLKHSLWGVCVNRPGSEGTVAGSDPLSQVNTFGLDVLAVLDELKIAQAGILCMCAGAAFAMAFCTTYPERTSGKFLALAPWTLPADCPDHKPLLRFAAHYLPTNGVGSLVGSLQYAMLNLVSTETLSKKLMQKASDVEKQALHDRYQTKAKDEDSSTFAEDLEWVLGPTQNEQRDITVCLSKCTDLGFAYSELRAQDVLIWQGDKDTIAHPPATKWLAKELPNANLHFIPKSTHEGALFMLDIEYVDALSHLLIDETPPR